MMNDYPFFEWGLNVIRNELAAIAKLPEQLEAEAFNQACRKILSSSGRVIVLGIGKSGHIGNKIAATLASTGTPAFFVHAAEASHGDFGMITQEDIIIAISNSGNTGEIVALLPLFKKIGVQLISITGNPSSALAQAADINLNSRVEKEAGPLDLAPTSSTTVALVIGDALAMALLHARDFKADDFALSHPGGALGKRLLLTVGQLMHSGDTMACVADTATLQDALLEMSSKRLGMTTIVDEQHRLLGLFTDGDLRRAMASGKHLLDRPIHELMVTNFKTTQADTRVFETFNQMEQHKITTMPVVDTSNRLVGILHLHDILQAGVIG